MADALEKAHCNAVHTGNRLETHGIGLPDKRGRLIETDRVCPCGGHALQRFSDSCELGGEIRINRHIEVLSRFAISVPCLADLRA